MTRLSYEVVDVFTHGGPFTGNPLAVVLDGEGLSTDQMQRLADEFNLSETVFPLSPERGGDYRVRIFTPASELPFAGHPSVGCGWLLAQLGRIEAGPAVQECGAGLLTLEIGGDGASLTGGEPTLGPILDPYLLLAGLGLSPSDVAGAVREAGTGTDWTFLPVVSAGVVDACEPTDVPGGVFVYHRQEDRIYARFFAPGLGVPEDPATGSAALGLGVILRHNGATGAFTIEQGVAMGRPSRMALVVGEHLTVAGTCERVAAGTVLVP